MTAGLVERLRNAAYDFGTVSVGDVRADDLFREAADALVSKDTALAAAERENATLRAERDALLKQSYKELFVTVSHECGPDENWNCPTWTRIAAKLNALAQPAAPADGEG